MRRRKGFTLIELMIVIAIIAILASILIPNFVKARAQSQHTACCSNVKNIGTACEMYSTENQGHYPNTMTLVTGGGYMQSAPTCPSANSNTVYNTIATNSNPDRYTTYCSGSNHSDLGCSADYPQFTSTRGLLRKNSTE
jgi:prepilin-type N-terminal cleavage/methylation domain-containing protein